MTDNTPAVSPLPPLGLAELVSAVYEEADAWKAYSAIIVRGEPDEEVQAAGTRARASSVARAAAERDIATAKLGQIAGDR
jgi:hypothetical protein